MIQLADVSKVYDGRDGAVRALDSVSLSVEAGEFVAVRGPSGCGKSTLLSLVGGLATPTSGVVRVDGRDISAMSSGERAAYRAQSVGFVFQMFHLLPYLSLLDNVLVASAPADREDAQRRAAKLLEKFGLNERLKHLPGELSAGERQRVAMARALLNGPKILLADEPTGNLDPKNADVLLDMIGEFQRSGGTVLLVTHDERAAVHAGRTIHLDNGRIAEEDKGAGRQLSASETT